MMFLNSVKVIGVLLFLLSGISYSQAGKLEIVVEQGKEILKKDGVSLLTVSYVETTSPKRFFVPSKVEQNADGEFVVSYKSKGKDNASSLRSIHTVCGEKVVNRYQLHISADRKAVGMNVHFVGQPPANDLPTLWKSGIWTPDAKGGVPYEVNDGSFQRFEYPSSNVWVRFESGRIKGRRDARNIVLSPVAEKKNEFEGSSQWIVLPKDKNGADASAVSNDYFCGLQLKTPRNFNLWETGQPEFSAEVWNYAADRKLDAELNLFVRDYDGKTVFEQKYPLALQPGECWVKTITPVPADQRGIWFVEAVVTSGGKKIFTRTNIALLPPHEYRRPQESFGISAFFPIPSEETVCALLKRIGVRNIRNGDQRKTAPLGIRSYGHYNLKRTASPKKATALLREKLAEMKEKQVVAFELANEWNMNKKGEQRRKTAEQYARLYQQAVQMESDTGCQVPLLPLGLAGGDVEFLKEMKKAGLWNELTGIVIHPGRGNVTPDYDGPMYWCYLGTIRKVKKFLKENGDKKLYLSEVYATTPPNTTWNDSYRRAGENVLLSLALGVAEGVETIQFYQMHDATWYDRGGVNPKYHEYHYGLLLRYGAIKPSLLAYATAAEELDGAVFKRYISQPDSTLRGMVFDTPTGEMTILYDRSEGCFQSSKSNPDKTLEPWQDHWKVQKDYSFAANGKPVVVKDCMGREKKVVVKDGKVQLKLSGAPLIVRGVNVP